MPPRDRVEYYLANRPDILAYNAELRRQKTQERKTNKELREAEQTRRKAGRERTKLRNNNVILEEFDEDQKTLIKSKLSDAVRATLTEKQFRAIVKALLADANPIPSPTTTTGKKEARPAKKSPTP